MAKHEILENVYLLCSFQLWAASGVIAGTLQRSRSVFGVSLGVIWRPLVAPRAHLGIRWAAWESLGTAEGTFMAPREAQGDPYEATSLIE